ncbi:MAG: hypothetical protein V5B60_18115 [Accumulibacter sp.]|jgi:hypothetical protein|uniref:hypothetical protein n=1 Tax=Accumulibacter sp. TaxID=2053492 RepID=UPI002FC2CE12
MYRVRLALPDDAARGGAEEEFLISLRHLQAALLRARWRPLRERQSVANGWRSAALPRLMQIA